MKNFHDPSYRILLALGGAPNPMQKDLLSGIAKVVFEREALPAALSMGWADHSTRERVALTYDALVSQNGTSVRIRIELQWLKLGMPAVRSSAKRGHYYLAEIHQRLSHKRTIRRTACRDDEFDLLAVCMFPSTGDWREFRFALVRDLVRRPHAKHLLAVLQPVPCSARPTGKWSADLVAKLDEIRRSRSS